jgi:hypothetical protein
MKDRPFSSQILTELAINALTAVSNATNASFSELAKIAGLDRKNDFRYADLSHVDLSYSDIRGFDFVGADLTGAAGINVIWDDSTTLRGADLSDSIFASETRIGDFLANNERALAIFRRVSLEDWAGQILWCGNNLFELGPYRDVALPVTEALLYKASDSYLRSEFLNYILSSLNFTDIVKEIILTELSNPSVRSSGRLKVCLKAIRRWRLAHDKTIRAVLDQMQESEIFGAEVLGFLIGTSVKKSEMISLRERASEHGIDNQGGIYVSEIARRLGDVYDLITRDPDSNETFAISTRVPPHTRDLIARKWARIEHNFEGGQSKRLSQRRPGFGDVSDAEVADRSQKIEAMWKELHNYGIEIVVDPKVRYLDVSSPPID